MCKSKYNVARILTVPRNKGEKYVRVNISLPEPLMEKAKTYCEDQPVPIAFSGLLKMLLEKYLEEQLRENGGR